MAQRDMELALRIRAELAEARREIAGLRRDIKGAGESTKAAGRDMRGMNRELDESERRMKGLGGQARLLKQALGGLSAALVIREIIANTARQEQAMADLEAAVRSTGGAAGFTSEQLAGMAGELQRVTTYGDESIMEMQAVLLTFKNVAGSVFGETSELILDMATRMKTDLKSAALQVGKALNDPVGGIDALSRAGVQFDETQKRLIKSLVQTGDLVGAQKVILAELRTQFGGAARAARDNFGGALQALRNVVGDLLEGKQGLPEATAQINRLTDMLASPDTQAAFGAVIGLVLQLVGAVAQAVEFVGKLAIGLQVLLVGAPDALVRTGDEIRALDEAIAATEERLANSRAPGMIARLTAELEALRKKRAELIAQEQQIIDERSGYGQPRAGGGPTSAAPAAPSEDFLKARDDLTRRIALLGKETSAEQVLWEVQNGRYKDLAQNEKDALVALARRLDAGADGQRQIEEARRAAEAARDYVEQLERQAAMLGLNAAQVRAYELAEKNLTGALRARAQAALAAIDADERKRRADENARTNAGLQAEYMRAIGREGDAAVLEMNTRFAELRRQMIDNGNAAGMAWIDQLIPVNQARIRLEEVRREIDQAFSEQGRREQSIDAQVNAGLITQIEGRKRLVELHQQTAATVERYLPALREMAALPGPMGEQARAALENLETQLIRLRTTTNELQNALRDGLQSGIAGALSGLADGTKEVEDAALSLVQSIAQALGQLAAQRLAEQATDSLMGLFGGAQETGAAVATQAAAVQLAAAGGAVTTGAGALGASSATLTAAAGLLPGGAAAIQAAAVQLQAAAAAMAAANAASSAVGLGFATGGHVLGAGTGTSDSIPAWLSNFEFVTRSAVVRQPGALDFLHDFNRRGMAALDDWSRRVRHATGGLAGIPAPMAPAPLMSGRALAEPAKLMSPTLNNRFRFLNVFDIEDIARRVAATRTFEREVVNAVGSNPRAVNERLGR